MRISNAGTLFNKHKMISLIVFVFISSFAQTAAMAGHMTKFSEKIFRPIMTVSPLNPFGYLPKNVSSILFLCSLGYLIFSLVKYRNIEVSFKNQSSKISYNFLKIIGRLFLIILIWASALSIGIAFDHLDPNKTALSIFYTQSIFLIFYLGCLFLRKILISKNSI